MTTKRTAMQRRPTQPAISARAVEIFERMEQCRCTCSPLRSHRDDPCAGCTQWRRLHIELEREIPHRP